MNADNVSRQRAWQRAKTLLMGGAGLLGCLIYFLISLAWLGMGIAACKQWLGLFWTIVLILTGIGMVVVGIVAPIVVGWWYVLLWFLAAMSLTTGLMSLTGISTAMREPKEERWYGLVGLVAAPILAVVAFHFAPPSPAVRKADAPEVIAVIAYALLLDCTGLIIPPDDLANLEEVEGTPPDFRSVYQENLEMLSREKEDLQESIRQYVFEASPEERMELGRRLEDLSELFVGCREEACKLAVAGKPVVFGEIAGSAAERCKKWMPSDLYRSAKAGTEVVIKFIAAQEDRRYLFHLALCHSYVRSELANRICWLTSGNPELVERALAQAAEE